MYVDNKKRKVKLRKRETHSIEFHSSCGVIRVEKETSIIEQKICVDDVMRTKRVSRKGKRELMK